MSIGERFKHIGFELKGHAPFTLFGAVLGIAFMLLFSKASAHTSYILFTIFHPGHVLLSAMVTASMFGLHSAKKNILLIVVVGYVGSIGIATLSDIIIPHFGSAVLGLDMPAHGEVFHEQHEHQDAGEAANEELQGEHAAEQMHSEVGHEEHKHPKIHLGFIEEWYIVNPAAFIGIFIAYIFPRTKFPHAMHILVSTWASSSYLLMDMREQWSLLAGIGIFATLFISVWIPCCVSDIVFPLLFVKPDVEITGGCPLHAHHSHSHSHVERRGSQ
ncbi:MAG: hypothetical protein WC374_09035 [Phycisphaerae bacterium]